VVAPCGPPLGGRYELTALLATGGMGQVWRGRDVLLGRPVAVKVLRSEYTGDPTFLARFRAEAQHAGLLAHRNIAAVFDYGEVPAAAGASEHLAYLVMEFVEGESLSAVLAREGSLDVPRALDVLRQTAAGLAAAHAAGVVHRDVKPGNILVGADGVVRITDFGVAWSASNVPLTQTGQVVGTAQYLSPEQAEGSKGTPASDVYALGMIGYECLAGHRAFDGGTPVQIALRQIREEPAPLPHHVPEPVQALLARAMCKDPAGRFADGAAFCAAVDNVLAGRPVPVAGIRTRRLAAASGVAGVGRRRRSVLAPLVALLAGVAIGVGALQLVAARDSAAPAAKAAPSAGVVLRSADYVGRPVDEVEAALAALGLQVARSPVQNPEAPVGTVLGLDPVGALRPDDLVTVSYAVAPAPPAAPAAPAAPSEASPAAVEAAASAPTPDVSAVPVEVPVDVPVGVPVDARVEAATGGSAGNADGGKAHSKGDPNGNGNGGGNGKGRGNGKGHGRNG